MTASTAAPSPIKGNSPFSRMLTLWNVHLCLIPWSSLSDTNIIFLVTDPADKPWPMANLPAVPYELFPVARYTIGIMDAPMHERRLPGLRVRTT